MRRKKGAVDGADASATKDIDTRRSPTQLSQLVKQIAENTCFVRAPGPTARQNDREPPPGSFDHVAYGSTTGASDTPGLP